MSFFFFFWGCWEYVYVMLTFICSCLYLILRNTNSWFKIKNTIKIYCETSSSLFTITPVPTPLPVNHKKRFLCIYFYSLPFLLFLHKNNPALPPLPLPQHCFLLISPCLFTESFYDGSVCHIIWLMMTWKEGWCLEAISANQTSLSYLNLQICDHSTMCECGFLYIIYKRLIYMKMWNYVS